MRSLKAENKSPHTINAYLQAIRSFGVFLDEHHFPTEVSEIERGHVEDWLIDLQSSSSGGTANTRYRGLQRFFAWLVEEDEIGRSPMDRMKPPSIPESPPTVLTDEQLKRLLKACDGKEFADRRDMAILRLFIDTGMRCGECAALTTNDLDLDAECVEVLGKGRRRRIVPIGNKTIKALDRYLRERAKHKDAQSPRVWLGQHGSMTAWGIYQALERRATVAGVDGVHPHLFRHGFAHQWLKEGGQEGDLMSIAGWRSRNMLSRYGASAAGARA